MHCSIVYILVQKYNIMMEKYTLLRLLQIWSTNCCLMMHISRYRVRGNCICTVYIKLAQCSDCINLHCFYVKALHCSALFIYEGIQAAESPHSGSDQFRLRARAKKCRRRMHAFNFCTSQNVSIAETNSSSCRVLSPLCRQIWTNGKLEELEGRGEGWVGGGVWCSG